MTKKDAHNLYASATRSRTQLIDWMSWPEQFHLRDAHRYIKMRIRSWRASNTNRRSMLGLVIRYRNEFAGAMDVSVFYGRNIGLSTSYWIDTSLAGNGIARHALHMLAELCCFKLNVPRFYVLVDQNNKASETVVRHVRGVREGVSFDSMDGSCQIGKGSGTFDIWKLTRSTILPEAMLFQSLSEPCSVLPRSVDLPMAVTGIPGTIRLYSRTGERICIHYFEKNAREDICFPLGARSDSFSIYVNKGKTIAPARARTVRHWIAENRRIIRNYGTHGDLWTVEERDTILADLKPVQDDLSTSDTSRVFARGTA